MKNKSVGAIILAAGLSSRMGRLKPLITIGQRTLLGHAITLFNSVAVDDLVVVTGHQSEGLQQELDKYSCRSVHNPHYTDGMFSSVQAGVKSLAAGIEAFFLLPVDIPLVTRQTVIRVKKAIEQDSSLLVVYPEYETRRGHPPLISCELIYAILTSKDQGGLRTVLRSYHHQSGNVSVDDPFILLDTDTQHDVNLLKKFYNTKRHEEKSSYYRCNRYDWRTGP